VLVEHCGDLTEFDPQAPDVHLLVESTQVDQLAVGTQPHQIACAVMAAARRVDEEFGPIEVWMTHVTAADRNPTDDEFTGGVGRDGLTIGVDHSQLDPWYRRTERW